jgi:MinD-like ATPase involved in chromosome partitioning or flagellar assembly
MAVGQASADRTTIATFYSYAGGAGRSCTVANLALILASLGHRVLVADLDLPSPSLHRYLEAFLPESVGLAATLPVRLTCEFAAPTGLVDFLGPTTDIVANPEDFAVGREDLAAGGYDYVLIDSPAGAAPGVELVTEELPDVLVVGYNLSQQAIDGAAQRARAAQRRGSGAPLRILPVAMRVDVRARGTTQRMRAAARRQFAWLLADLDEERRRRYWNDIEIPYESDYALEEGLPFLDDPSEQRDSLLNAYLRLAAVLTRSDTARAAEPGAVLDVTRALYRASRFAAQADDSITTVLHAAADRSWGEWLVAELGRLGVQARRQRIDLARPEDLRGGPSVLLVLSAHLLDVPRVGDYLAAIDVDPAQARLPPLAVNVDRSQIPGRFPAIGHIELAGQTAEGAVLAVAPYYPAADPETTAPDGCDPRYPGDSTAERPWNLPARSPSFRGRDDVMDQIRDHFTSADAGRALTIVGAPGIGKSQLALEYAYRFAAQYDLVWLVRADSSQSTQAGLAELAHRTSLPSRGDAPTAILGDLQSERQRRGCWLLIYDGADAPDDVAGLLPAAGHGHVLVTSRSSPVDTSAYAEVRPLDTPEADGLLTELVPDITPADASKTAADLQGTPLAIRMAAAWIRVVAQHLRDAGMSASTVTAEAVIEFREQLARNADGARPVPSPHPVPQDQRQELADPLETTCSLLVELLERDAWGAAAIYLLETCACLSPVGLSQRLLSSPGMLAQLCETDQRISDPIVLNNVLRTLFTHGFSLLGESSRAPLQVHQLILEILRARMTPDQLTARSAAVGRMLATSAPPDTDNDTRAHAGVYAELQQHLEPSGAWRNTEEPVRRWLVNQVRYLWQSDTLSAWRTAAELGERLRDHWAATIPAAGDDPLFLRLGGQLASVYRSQGEAERARELDSEVVATQRRVLGLRHLRTLMTARGYAADLRLLGDFQGALLEDQSTWQAFAQALGDGHMLTIIASSNLAVAELLTGEPEQALGRQQSDRARCRRFAAERPDEVPWITYHTGTLLRELGLYEESEVDLDWANEKFEELVNQEIIQPTTAVALRTAAGLAMTRRRLGQPDRVLTAQILASCREIYGESHPDTLAISLSLAGDLHAEGEHDASVHQAERAFRGLRAVFGETHPFTQLCRVNVSSYALAAGDTVTADEMSHLGWSSLSRTLGEQHLWCLAASIARANALAATGELDRARALDEAAAAEYRRRMGSQHSFTRIAEANAEDTRRQLLARSGADPRGTGQAPPRQFIELDIPPT